MTKQEFLQGLRSALEGEVPAATIHENLRYYDSYIGSELQKGRTEAEVIAELGEPRWIAKTIIDTTPGAGEGRYGEPEGSAEEYSGEPRRDPFSGQKQSNIHFYDLNKWYVKLAVIVVLLLIFWLLLAIVGGAFVLFLRYFWVIAAIAVVVWIVRGPRR